MNDSDVRVLNLVAKYEREDRIARLVEQDQRAMASGELQRRVEALHGKAAASGGVSGDSRDVLAEFAEETPQEVAARVTEWMRVQRRFFQRLYARRVPQEEIDRAYPEGSARWHELVARWGQERAPDEDAKRGYGLTAADEEQLRRADVDLGLVEATRGAKGAADWSRRKAVYLAGMRDEA